MPTTPDRFAVLNMDGASLFEGSRLDVEAWLEADAEGHARLKDESHGAYDQCYWPRSVVCADGDHQRSGQWSSSWGCHHEDSDRCPALNVPGGPA